MTSRLQAATHDAATALVYTIRDCERGRAIYGRIMARAQMLEKVADAELRSLGVKGDEWRYEAPPDSLDSIAIRISKIEGRAFAILGERSAALMAVSILAAKVQILCSEFLD